MKRLLWFVLLLAVSVAQAQNVPDPGAAKARRLLDQMIQALGGQAYLSWETIEQEGRTYGFSHGEPSGAGTVFWRYYKWPDKERVELTKKRDWIVIHNGDSGSEITFRGVEPEEAPALKDYQRRRYYSLENVVRRWLKQPDLALFYEGQSAAAQRPADQVSLMNSKNEGVTLYLDINNHLPIQKTFVWRDPETKERNTEAEIYDNYKSIQGIMTPLSITRMKNGLNTNQRFLTVVHYNQPMPDAMFDAAAVARTRTSGNHR